mmetsp:Transcript_17234/g.36441  ORF Transcript_17234/g.36441 Transcript_17234/m.36441 type:complete len:724 (+) Transcript_17234:658-2829(+)
MLLFECDNSENQTMTMNIQRKIKTSKDPLDHPENKKLDKESGENFALVNGGRYCTDVLFLLLLTAAWVAMTGVGLASTGIIKSDIINKGDPNRLINGMDYHGNLCGVTNYITPDGVDTINLPKAYPMPSGFFVCVDSCPAESSYDAFICEYEIQHEITKTVNVTSLDTFIDVDDATKSLYLFHAASKQCMPKIASMPFLGYCIPTTPLDEVIILNSTPRESNNTNNTKETDLVTNKTTTDVFISTETEASSSSNFFDQVITDAHTSRYVIFTFGCGVSLALGIIFLVVLQLPGILSILVWIMIIVVDIALVGAGYYSRDVSIRWASGTRPGNEATALYYGSFVLYSLAGAWCLLILFMRKKIMLAIACVREASSAISSQPIITIFPIVQVVGLFAFSIVWGIYMAFLASSGDIVSKCFCPNSIGKDSHLNITSTSLVDSHDGFCGEGCLIHKEMQYSNNTVYAGIYMLSMWFWTSQFIVAVGQIVISLSISLWYFNRDRKLVSNATFLKAVSIATFYHLGTAAFGSLVIAIIKTIRTILTYMEKKAARSKQKVVLVIMRILKCLLWCLEKCVKFVNKQAYIQTAIFGYPFCKAARMGFFLILRNSLRISAVSVVSQFILFIGKVFITVASTVPGYLYLEKNYGNELNFVMVPTLLIAVTAYAASEMFNEVFGMSISTILQCFVADEEMFEGDERFAPSSLAGTIDSTQQGTKKKKKVVPDGGN